MTRGSAVLYGVVDDDDDDHGRIAASRDRAPRWCASRSTQCGDGVVVVDAAVSGVQTMIINSNGQELLEKHIRTYV